MAEISKGAAGEVLAARFLRENGYTLLTANQRSRFGEIDLIAYKNPYLVFAEVKTRQENGFFQPGETVTIVKQKKLVNTSMLYIQAYAKELEQVAPEYQIRFDVIEVTTKNNSPMTAVEIRHHENAFEAQGGLHAAF